jgi:hypothetical protein
VIEAILVIIGSIIIVSLLIIVNAKYIPFVSEIFHGSVFVEVKNGMIAQRSGSGPELKSILKFVNEILKSVPNSTFIVIMKYNQFQFVILKNNNPDENDALEFKCKSLLPKSRLTKRSCRPHVFCFPYIASVKNSQRI